MIEVIYSLRQLARLRSRGEGPLERADVKLYRVNKLAKPGGVVVKKKHILADNDSHAVKQAEDSDDCPVCDVLRDGKTVGQVR